MYITKFRWRGVYDIRDRMVGRFHGKAEGGIIYDDIF